jgi:tetratricopeptide (TPR) repeat protein
MLLSHTLLLLALLQTGAGRAPKLPPPSPTGKSAPASPADAYLLLKAGKFCAAVSPLQRLQANGGTDLRARTALVEALFKCHKTSEGESALREFWDLPAAAAADQVKLAKTLAEDGLPAAAQETLEHLLAASPDNAEAHARLGIILFNKGQNEPAIEHLGRAVQLDPASPVYSMQLAEALLRAKQYPTALEFLAAVRDRFGTLPEYHYKVAWGHYGMRQLPQAAAELESLVREHPEMDLPHYSLGNCYIVLGRLADAETQYRAAIRINPRKASYYDALAQVLRKQGKGEVEEAITLLEKAQRLDPGDAQGAVQLALCYEQKGNLAKAQEYLQAAIRQQPDMLDAHRVLARVYYRQGNSPGGDQEAAIVSKLDSEQLRQRRSRLGMDPSAAPSF